MSYVYLALSKKMSVVFKTVVNRTHIAHVRGVDVGAGAVGGGLSLLEVVSSCVQSLIQLSEAGLQLAWLTCTEAKKRGQENLEGNVFHENVFR